MQEVLLVDVRRNVCPKLGYTMYLWKCGSAEPWRERRVMCLSEAPLTLLAMLTELGQRFMGSLFPLRDSHGWTFWVVTEPIAESKQTECPKCACKPLRDPVNESFE